MDPPTLTIDRTALPGRYVPETRFGEWFQRTDIWRRYVVEEAVAELASLLPPASGPFATVLDAGCGEGVAFGPLRRVFGAGVVVGVDIHAGAVEGARRAAARVGATVQVRRADAVRLPLDDGAVDLVFCHQLLHHAVDPAQVLAELHRVLAPGGWLLVAESCRSFLEWWPVRLLFRHPPRAQHTAAQYRALVAAAGFRVDDPGFLTPAPWWSQRDLGLRGRWSLPAIAPEPTQVRIAARRVTAGQQP